MNKQNFIYTYIFIYDNEKIKELENIEKAKKLKFFEQVKHTDKFFVYFDKFYKNKIKKFNVLEYYKKKSNANFIITDFKDKYNFKFNDVFIYFFPNNLAFLVLDVEVNDYKTFEDLYKFNSLFVKIYSKQSNSYIIKSDTFSSKTDKTEIKEFCEKCNLSQNDKGDYVFTAKEIKEFFDKFNPYKIDKYLKDRIGLIKNDNEDNTYLLKNKLWEDLHYANYKKVEEELKPFRAVHYDTFFTSFYVDFVKINTKIEYYDNFNPLDTNYLHVYTTFIEDNLKENLEENFAKYEPFLHNKKSKGEILVADFFDIYQTQADWFIIGNEQNLINILKKETYDKIQTNIKNQRFLLYLFMSFQSVFLTMAENKLIFSNTGNFFKKVNFIIDSMDEYVEFLSNYNFVDISDEPSINSYYKFLQKNKNIHNKLDALKALSGFHRSFKNITQNLISKKSLIVWIILTPIIFKAINEIYKFIWDLLNGFCSSNLFWCGSLGVLIVVLAIVYMFFEKDKDN